MLIKPILVTYDPGHAGHPAVPAVTVCPDDPPPNNGGVPVDSGGGAQHSCFIVANPYGGTMQVCV